MTFEREVISAARGVEASFPPGLTDRRRGYTSFQGGQRILRRLEDVDTNAEMRHLIRSFANMSGLPYFDQGLTLAIAFRESGAQVLSGRRTRIDSFRAGGLDRIYDEAPRLVRNGYLPRSVQQSLLPGTTEETEGSTATRPRHAAAARIFRRDLLVTYGAVLAQRHATFLQRAADQGLSTHGMSQRAIRLWTALHFGGPNGLPYASFIRQLPSRGEQRGWIASNFGARTVMDFMVSAGHAAGEIGNLDRHEATLYRMTRVMAAFVVVAEAEVIDQIGLMVRRVPHV